MSQTYECEVFEGAAFIARWGINEGASLGPVSDLSLGDRYALLPQTRPSHLTLALGPSIRVRAVTGPAADLLDMDAPLAVQGALKLMAPDSEVITALLLRAGQTVLLLPLNPMRVDLDYTLIAIDPDANALRMSELVTGCFAPGARVTLGDGHLCPVEALTVGQMLRTRDHGPQPLRWIGRVTARAHGAFAPVTFPAGCLGNLGALTTGPLQRIFLYQRSDERLGPQAEILVQAQYLVDGRRVLQREGGYAEYYSLVFDSHQIIYVEGIPVDSMLVSRATLDRLPSSLAEDLSQRFPHLNQHAHFAQELPAAKVTEDLRTAILRNKEK